MTRAYFFSAVALIALAGQCAADTTLGGVTDYLPSCFQEGQGDFMLFIEYNNVITNGVRAPIYILEHRTLEGMYSAPIDDMISSKYVPPKKAENYLVNTVLQPFNIRNKTHTKYLGISLSAGIRMIRFRYIPNVFEPDWMRGVQVRFTKNMVSKINMVEHGVESSVEYDENFGFRSTSQTLGIDLECFMAVGSIQPENRLSDFQLESCLYLVPANATRYYAYHDNDYVNGKTIPGGIDGNYFAEDWMVRNSIEMAECEQKARVIVPPPPQEDPLISAIKFIAVAAVGFIPVFGPVLAFGLSAGFELAESQEKYNQFMLQGAGNYAVGKAQEDYPKLVKFLSKARRR